MSISTIIFIIACTLFTLALSISTITVPSQPRRIICYFTPGTSLSNLGPSDLDPNLCTHILVGFFSPRNNSINLSIDDETVIQQVVDLKKRNSNLKVLLSLGGGGEPEGFPDMVQSETNRSIFVKSIESVITKLNLDGIDLDWEFPSNIFIDQKGHFTKLLGDIRQSIDNSARKYILSVAVAAPITLVSLSYDIAEMNRLVDFINVMSYDYNFFSLLTPWTGMNAPLYARSVDNIYFQTQNINFTGEYWVRKGMSRQKINMGLPVYAHTYTLASPQKTYLGAPAIGDGVLGGGGSAPYGEVCSFMQQQKLVPIFDEETKSPYVTNGSEWVSFENDESISYKAKHVYDNDFGGVMIFSLNTDDYGGLCKNGETFPNTKIIHDIFTK